MSKYEGITKEWVLENAEFWPGAADGRSASPTEAKEDEGGIYAFNGTIYPIAFIVRDGDFHSLSTPDSPESIGGKGWLLKIGTVDLSSKLKPEEPKVKLPVHRGSVFKVDDEVIIVKMSGDGGGCPFGSEGCDCADPTYVYAENFAPATATINKARRGGAKVKHLHLVDGDSWLLDVDHRIPGVEGKILTFRDSDGDIWEHIDEYSGWKYMEGKAPGYTLGSLGEVAEYIKPGRSDEGVVVTIFPEATGNKLVTIDQIDKHNSTF